MFHTCIVETGQVFDPDGITLLQAALVLACDRWDLDEPLTDASRSELAAAILAAAQAGFADSDTLARIALNKCRIAVAVKFY